MADNFELEDGDSALIIQENGEVRFILPERDGDEVMPESDLLIVGISMALRNRDQRLLDLVWKVLEEADASKSKERGNCNA